MDHKVRVRLVPKNKQGEALTLKLGEITPPVAKHYAPDAGRANEALRTASAMGMETALTTRNSLESFVAADQFEQTFKTKLSSKQREKSEFSAHASGTEAFLSPADALEVPDDLRDTIAFAYVPTPPEFFAPRLIPPNISLYHLRLNDILRVLGGSLCHRQGWTGRGIRVAMADTGFARHPYFDSQGYTIQRVSTPSTSHPAIDSNGHGTGESANVLILAPDCTFMGVKHDDYSAEALETSLAQNPQIITNSWGWDIDRFSKSQLQQLDPNLFNELLDVERIIADAIDDGVTVIFAGGNGQKAFPACMPEVIAVGGVTVASDGDLEASSYASSFRSLLYPGRQVPDFCAIVGAAGNRRPLKGHIMLPVPSGSMLEGENMPQNQSNKGWGVFSGTSAAAPQVAGIAALMLSVNPNLTPADVRMILTDTAIDVTTGTTANNEDAHIGFDFATGAGFVNAFAACQRAAQLLPPT